MRLGIFGGSFDPVHYGHLILAEQCREQCELDEVWFVPARQPPHKTARHLSPEKARMEMLELATAGHEAFRVSDIELRREGLSYTVDTLQQLHDEGPQRELFFLIGGDSLFDLPHWREPDRIAELATIVAVNRAGRRLPERSELEQLLGPSLAARIKLVTMPAVDLSSTDIRARVQQGRSIRYLVPRAVEQYILEHGLYR